MKHWFKSFYIKKKSNFKSTLTQNAYIMLWFRAPFIFQSEGDFSKLSHCRHASTNHDGREEENSYQFTHKTSTTMAQ